MNAIIRATAIIAAALVAATTAEAQGRQYTAPGELRRVAIRGEESIETAMEEARWNLGKVRIDPVLFIRNVETYSNLLSSSDQPGPESDLRASLGAGLVAYLPVGPDLIASAAAVPEYAWWQKQTELRNLIGRYNAGLYGYFNRLTMSLTGSRLDQESPLNAEVDTPVQTLQQQASFSFELDLGAFLSVAGSAGISSVEQPEDLPAPISGLDLQNLDRETATFVIGGRYRRDAWEIGLDLESAETDFDNDPQLRSNTSFAPGLMLGYSRGRLDFNARVWQRSVEFETTSELADTDEATGEASLSVQLRRRFGASAYAGRSLVYSALAADNYFTDQRWGAALTFDPAERIDLAIFVETGELSFALADESDVRRRDDYQGWGAGLTIRLTERARLEIGFSERDYDSNVPGLDRTIRSGGGTVRIGGDLLSW